MVSPSLRDVQRENSVTSPETLIPTAIPLLCSLRYIRRHLPTINFHLAGHRIRKRVFHIDFGTFKYKGISKFRVLPLLCVYINWKLYRARGEQQKLKETDIKMNIVESSFCSQILLSPPLLWAFFLNFAETLGLALRGPW